MSAPKLYVVVREDIPPGDQAVQAMHAARQFAAEHPEEELAWYSGSNHLAFLAVPGPEDLAVVRRSAEARGISLSGFCEPDMGGQETAVAMGPSGKRVCRGLPKALRGL